MSPILTVITGTNRLESNSEIVALDYAKLLKSKGCLVNHIHLRELPETMAFSETYGNRTAEFQKIIDEKITNCEKFVFIIPEYNGSFPGVLKTLMDAVPPSEWNYKKAGLIGLSSGRAGALRATDQFSGILNYLKVNVYFSKPKLAGIQHMLNGHPDSEPVKEYASILDAHADGLMAF
ncbi:MAG: NADPH-dependent FMN reductase [Flavobacteriales bacterium]